MVDMLSKLNPSAKEFVPSAASSGSDNSGDPSVGGGGRRLSADAPEFVASRDRGRTIAINGGSFADDQHFDDQHLRRRKRIFYRNNGKFSERVQRAQTEECIRRTVYVSDIDHRVTEQQLAGLFVTCGHVVDCRICGDPRSALRFAFVEFASEYSARLALNLDGTVVGMYSVKINPSRTAILPVNPVFLPQSEDERERCARTVYCTNIDKMVSEFEVKEFFESSCGEVSCIRLLGDQVHSSRNAFVEFVEADSAISALSCSGMMLGKYPIRISPSKTPIRPPPPNRMAEETTQA